MPGGGEREDEIADYRGRRRGRPGKITRVPTSPTREAAMRTLGLLTAVALSCHLVPAAGPPAPVGPEVLRLIDQLGDDDLGVRAEASKKLEALGEGVVPALRAAAQTHADVDVRLRVTVLARAIEQKLYGEVRR